MTIYPTGHQCRCPSCKGFVDRGIRESDSQFVAICDGCGNPVLEIDQPPAQPLKMETRNAIINIPILSEADRALLERVTRLRDDMPWPEFFPLLGIPAAVYEARFLGPLRHGNLDPVRTKRLVEGLDRFERLPRGKSEMTETQTPPSEERPDEQKAGATEIIHTTGNKDAPAPEKETTQDKSVRRVQELRGILHVTWGALGLKLGYASKTAIQNMINRHKTGNLSDEVSADLLARVRKVEAEMGLPGDDGPTTAAKSEEAPPAPIRNTDLARDAISTLKRFKADHGGTWSDVADAMNSTGGDREFKGGALTVAISPSNHLSEQYANDIIRAIDIFDMDEHKKKRLDEKTAVTPKKRLASKAKAAKPPAKKKEPNGKESGVVPESGTIIMKYGADVHAVATRIIEDLFGLSIEELAALKPAIEHLAVAYRNGTGARVIVDPVRINPSPSPRQKQPAGGMNHASHRSV